MTDPDSTMQGTTVDAGQAPPAETQDPAVEPESFDADYVRKLRAEAARYRTEAKSNAAAAKELEALRQQQMTEVERAVADAERKGRDTARAEYARDLAEARFRTAAAARGVPVDAIADLVDVGRFVADGAMDDDAIAASIERLAKAIPPQKAQYPEVVLGPSKQDKPGQLSRDDLARMTPDQIVQAKAEGRLDTLLGITQ